MPKKKKAAAAEKNAKVHEELEGFNITIDRFGALQSNIKVDEINEFLNSNVDDKKLAEKGEEE